MKKPEKEPTKIMKALYKVGIIHTLTLNREMTSESHDEALSDCHGGYYTWDTYIDVIGDLEQATITMDDFDRHIGPTGGRDSVGGYWRMTQADRMICEEWEKWLAAEDRDLKTYKRLQKKFGANV